MTSIYFVRHAQPLYTWEDDRTRPLSEEGKKDAEKVYEIMLDTPIHYAVSSPYQRSMVTIWTCAQSHHLAIVTDERLRERVSGKGENATMDLIRRRWADFDYHERGGESLRMVQERNMDAVRELLENHPEENILVGTHGTALSTILNYYDPEYQFDDFLRIIDFTPYIIRLDFEGAKCVGKEEILIIKKEYKI